MNPAWRDKETPEARLAVAEQIRQEIHHGEMRLSDIARAEGVTLTQMQRAIRQVLGEIPRPRTNTPTTDDGAATLRQIARRSNGQLTIATWTKSREKPSKMHLAQTPPNNQPPTTTLCKKPIPNNPLPPDQHHHTTPCPNCVAAAIHTHNIQPPTNTPQWLRPTTRGTWGQKHTQPHTQKTTPKTKTTTQPTPTPTPAAA